MCELNSPLPLFEAPSGKARRRKHCALVVQTWVPNPEPEQNLHCRPGGQQKAAQLPVVSACPGKSPNCRSQPKRSSSEEGDAVPETSHEDANKGTFSMSEDFGREGARPPVAGQLAPSNACQLK